MSKRVAAAVSLIAILASCTTRPRPPYASDDEQRQDDDEGDSDAAEPFEPLPTGSDDSPCETVIDLPIVKPNFYFVVDASGSMLDRIEGSSTSRYRTAISAISNMLEGVQTRVNFGAAVFPNTHAGASCDAGNEVFPLEDGSSPATSTEPTPLVDLVTTLQRYSPEGGSPISTTLHELYPTLRSFSGDTYVFLLSDGAPNCNLAASCEADECILNLEGATFEDGTVCDDSLNCCAPDWYPHLCLDRAATLDELVRLREAKVSTYVIGLPGGAAYAGLLNEMAVAAGTPRTASGATPARDAGVSGDGGFATDSSAANQDVAPTAPNDELLYYQVSDADSLALALTTLRREILVDCTLQLDFAPTRPELLQVTVGEEVLTPDQWRLEAATEVELLGQVCDAWKAGELPQVRVQQTCRGPVR